MLTRSEVVSRIENPEGPLLERKPSGVGAREVRRTVVAFANSVIAPDEAVLFIGVRDDGLVEGCADTDKTQKMIRDVCDKQCYPPIAFRIEIIPERQNVVAVIIPPSDKRPHFTGQAFVRRGSESVAASAEIFDELIYSRNSKAAKLIEFKNKRTQVRAIGLGHRLGETRLSADSHHREAADCWVLDCNAQSVRLEKAGSQVRFSEPLENITLSYDEEKWCPVLVIKGY